MKQRERKKKTSEAIHGEKLEIFKADFENRSRAVEREGGDDVVGEGFLVRSNGLHGFEVSETSGIFTLPSEKKEKENPFSVFLLFRLSRANECQEA